MNVAWEETEDCEKQVDAEVRATTCYQKYAKRRDEDREDDETDCSDHFEVFDLKLKMVKSSVSKPPLSPFNTSGAGDVEWLSPTHASPRL